MHPSRALPPALTPALALALPRTPALTLPSALPPALPRTRALPLLLTLTLTLTLAGCAHTPAPRMPTAPGAVRQLTIETPNAVRGSDQHDALARALLEVGRDAGVELRGDGRLAELAARFAERDPVSASALLAGARAIGLADVALQLQRVHADSADLLAAALRVELPAAVQALRATHFGVHVLPSGADAVVVLSRRPFTLDAVPYRIAAGGSLHVRGRRAADVQGATLVWSDPFGRRRVFALSSDLELDVRLPARANGRHRVELREHAAGGEHGLLVFDVVAGEDSGERSDLELEREQLDGVRSELLAQLAVLRDERGLVPLESDPALAQRAGERCPSASEGPAANTGERAAADDAASGDPAPLRDARSALALGPDASALYSALLADSAFNARLLAADRTRLGLAVCTGASGLRALALYAGALPADNPELASGRVLLAINAHRKARAAAPLRPDAALTEIAQHAADALRERSDADQDAIMDRANAELERFALRYRRVAAVAVVVHDATEAATLEPALDAGASAIGIATAELRASGPSAPNVAVILALGWER